MIEEFPKMLVELAWAFVYGLLIGLGVFTVLVVAFLVFVVLATRKGPNPGSTSRALAPKVAPSGKCPWCLGSHDEPREYASK